MFGVLFIRFRGMYLFSHFYTLKNQTPFCEADDVLSNFYSCELDIFGITHNFADHDFKCIKAVRCGDLDSANSIKDADDARMTLQLGKKVKSNDQWESTRVKVMEEILINVYKCQFFATSCAPRSSPQPLSKQHTTMNGVLNSTSTVPETLNPITGLGRTNFVFS